MRFLRPLLHRLRVLFRPGRADPRAPLPAERAIARSEVLGRSLPALEARVERLGVAVQALWELLREETGLEDRQVTERIAEIEGR